MSAHLASRLAQESEYCRSAGVAEKTMLDDHGVTVRFPAGAGAGLHMCGIVHRIA